MAQKRMLNKSISLSLQVNQLSEKGMLIFTWCIPHLDDFGLLEVSAEVIKAMVFPLAKKITVKDIEEFKIRAKELNLIKIFQDCIEFTGFQNHQTISREKMAKSKFSKIPQENIGENNISQEFPVQDKLSKDKGREDNKSKSLVVQQVELTDWENKSLEFLKIKDIKNKSNQIYLKKFHKSLQENLSQFEFLLKSIKYFESSEYPYVIYSIKSLWEKKEKILARIAQEQLKNKNKVPHITKI